MAFTSSMIFRGDYDAFRQYAQNDVVFFEGGYYSAKGATLGNAPTDTSYWDLLTTGVQNIPIDASGRLSTDERFSAVNDALDDLDERVTALEEPEEPEAT